VCAAQLSVAGQTVVPSSPPTRSADGAALPAANNEGAVQADNSGKGSEDSGKAKAKAKAKEKDKGKGKDGDG
jgi:hypothetical protein